MKVVSRTIHALLPLTLILVPPVAAASPPPGQDAYIVTNPRLLEQETGERAKKRAFEDKAVQLLRAGDRVEAIQSFKSAYELGPLSDMDQFGDVLAAEGRLAEAIAVYRQLVYRGLGVDWVGPDGKSMRELVMDATPDSSVEWKNSRKWASSRGADPDVLMRYTLLLLRTGQRDEAWQVYQWGISRTWQYNDEYRPLFELHMSPQPQAFDASLLEAAARTVYGLKNVGGYYPTSGGWKSSGDIARSEFAKAIALKPNFAPAHLLLGNALDETKDEAGARVEWHKAVESDKSGHGAVRKLAETKLG